MTAARATADVVVVGAGSAGCLVAAQLARDPTRRVLLLEQGPLTPPPPEITRLTALPLSPGDRVVRHPELRGRDVVRGSGVGGSAAVNGGYFLRGHRDDYRAWPWPLDDIAAEFDRLDGGPGGTGGALRVTTVTGVGPAPTIRAFDAYWAARARCGPSPEGWPVIGLNHVRSNSSGGRRFTSADAFLTPEPHGPRLLRAHVTGLVRTADRITGVTTATGRIDAGEVILAAGTISSGALLLPLLGPLTPFEHPERIVRFDPLVALPPAPLLPSVLHTPEGLEIRCYADDFASYVPGLPRTGVPIGVSDMTRGTRGSIRAENGTVRLDLGEPDERSRERLAAGVHAVVEMLGSREFAHLVRPGSVRVDEHIGMSSHAWGTVPLGTTTDAAGAVAGTVGLRVADASVLPGPLRSGPHASVLMTAALIARTITT